MTKVAIKNENITSFGGIYHIMDVFSKLGFEKLTESVLGKRGSSGKAFSTTKVTEGERAENTSMAECFAATSTFTQYRFGKFFKA